MKKRIISTLMTICIVIGMVPAITTEAAAVEPVSDTVIEARINDLCNKLDGKYFNAKQDTSCGNKSRGHGCSNCTVRNIVKAQWFKNMFGEIKNVGQTGIDLNTQSCMGFVSFARWYILRVDDNDGIKVDAEDIKRNLNFNYKTVSQNAHIGDYFRCDNSHSVIYISCDANGVTVLDCNMEGQYNCLVKKHVIPYGTYKKFNLVRAYSKSAGKGTATETVKKPIVARPDDGTYTLAPACAPNSRLDIKGKSTSNGANAHIWKAYDDTSQIFTITSEGDGYYLITSDYTGKRLDVTNAKMSSGTNVQQWSANNNDAQRWIFEDAGDGYYYIVSKLTSGLCLDVNRGGSADGTNVQVWSRNGSNAQKWKLTPVEDKPKTVTLVFDPNDGTGFTWAHEVKETYGFLTDTSRDGYTLDGWYTSRQGGKRVTSSTRVDGEEEQITIYAHWTKVEPEATPTPKPIKIPEVIPTRKPAGEPEVPPASKPTEEPEVPPTSKPTETPEVPPTPEPTEEPKGHWGPWSDWSEKKVTASDTRQVERREVEDTPAYTEYRYGKWGNPTTKQGHACKNLAQQYYGSVAELTTNWSSTRYSPEKDYKIFCGGKNHTHKGCFYSDGNAVWYRYIVDGVTYFWEESREVEATYKTVYRYRDWVTD